ncbi:hypothetical protein V8F33_008824 [Rhypophila sp. PSN 637]
MTTRSGFFVISLRILSSYTLVMPWMPLRLRVSSIVVLNGTAGLGVVIGLEELRLMVNNSHHGLGVDWEGICSSASETISTPGLVYNAIFLTSENVIKR